MTQPGLIKIQLPPPADYSDSWTNAAPTWTPCDGQLPEPAISGVIIYNSKPPHPFFWRNRMQHAARCAVGQRRRWTGRRLNQPRHSNAVMAVSFALHKTPLADNAGALLVTMPSSKD